MYDPWVSLRLEHPRFLDIATLDACGRTVCSPKNALPFAWPGGRGWKRQQNEALHIAAQHGYADVCKVRGLNVSGQIHLNHSESRWLVTPKRWRFVRGFDNPMHGSVAVYFPGGIVEKCWKYVRKRRGNTAETRWNWGKKAQGTEPCKIISPILPFWSFGTCVSKTIWAPSFNKHGWSTADSNGWYGAGAFRMTGQLPRKSTGSSGKHE